MVAVPFVYFSFLLLYVLRKKKSFDISAYIISFYLISAFFSILIDVKDLRSYETRNYDIGIIPSIMYCLLITIVIYPFIKLPIQGKLNIDVKPLVFKYLSFFSIVSFLILIALSYNTMFQILSGDLGALREAIKSEGEITSVYENAPTFLKPIARIVTLFSNISLIVLLFYFYSISFLKKSKLFNSLLFMSSLSIVILAILGIDRSKIIYWLITYGFFLILFWKNMSRKQQRTNIFGISLILFALSAYFVSVTLSRFEGTDLGVDNSIISYAGQSFINFCYFFDNKPYQEYTLQRLFPIFYNFFVDNGINSAVELNRLMTYKTGIFHGIFASFIGDILMTTNIFTAVIYCLVISRITYVIIVKNKNTNSFYYLVLLFFFCSIPMLGLFTHFYSHTDRMFGFLLFVSYAFWKNNIVIGLKIK